MCQNVTFFYILVNWRIKREGAPCVFLTVRPPQWIVGNQLIRASMPSTIRQVSGMESRYSVSLIEWGSWMSGPMLIMSSAGFIALNVPHSSPA